MEVMALLTTDAPRVNATTVRRFASAIGTSKARLRNHAATRLSLTFAVAAATPSAREYPELRSESRLPNRLPAIRNGQSRPWLERRRPSVTPLGGHRVTMPPGIAKA